MEFVKFFSHEIYHLYGNSVHTIKLTLKIGLIFACYYYLQILVLLVIYYGISEIDYQELNYLLAVPSYYIQRDY